jgi:hypothetical protein
MLLAHKSIAARYYGRWGFRTLAQSQIALRRAKNIVSRVIQVS